MLVILENPSLDFGPFSIKWYAIIIAFGALCAFLMVNHEAKRQMFLNTDELLDFFMITFPLAIIGARFYYVLFNLSDYLAKPYEILAIWHGGLAIYGGLIVGAICVIVFCRRKNKSIFRMLDLLAPGVMLAQAIGRWGNFVNQEAYGGVTSAHFLRKVLHLPNFLVNRMEIDGFYRQPTFLYESLWNLLGLLLILALRHKEKIYLKGEIFAQYVLWYSFGRFFIEGERSDSLFLWGNIRVSQIFSAILFIFTLILVIIRRRSKKNKSQV